MGTGLVVNPHLIVWNSLPVAVEVILYFDSIMKSCIQLIQLTTQRGLGLI